MIGVYLVKEHGVYQYQYSIVQNVSKNMLNDLNGLLRRVSDDVK